MKKNIKKEDLNVHLIQTTQNAERILSFAKDTRLLGSVDCDETTSYSSPVAAMMGRPFEEVMKNVEYSLDTIGGPLEFIHFIFLVTGASRSFTHQLVRHRLVSFAQQSLRVSDNFGYYTPPKIESKQSINESYDAWILKSREMYDWLVIQGMDAQDARGVLPLHVTSAILMKVNLRALLEMIEIRLCLRVQGEHRSFMNKVKNITEETFPWLKSKLGPICLAKGICAFPRFDCPVSRGVPELKGLSDNKKKIISTIFSAYGDKGFQPEVKK